LRQKFLNRVGDSSVWRTVLDVAVAELGLQRSGVGAVARLN
jgi:hypothetical protein